MRTRAALIGAKLRIERNTRRRGTRISVEIEAAQLERAGPRAFRATPGEAVS